MQPQQIDAELTLRLPDPQRDAPAVLAAVCASQSEFYPWLPWATELQTITAVTTWLQAGVTRTQAGETLELVIEARGQVVGWIGLRHIDRWNRWAEVGYWLSTPMTGRGIMTRALRAMLDLSFTQQHLEKVILVAATDNRPSNRVAQSLGFQLDGTLRHNCRLADGYHDENEWSMLATEWPQS
ncbi:GNAT family N-acetyltransferase [Levilactobacillus acidifarinae]|nr:GNAT family protein [Levilactobacillus acidifarinae]GEO69276.1 ribosomal protein serine-acetylating enzyme [Levilactobacillus acidifarinae]